jgi:PAS domain-containing protein
MRIKHSRGRSQRVTPAPLSQRRRSKRRASSGSRGAPPVLVPRSSRQVKIEPLQWVAFAAIGLISLALITLMWTLTNRAIADQVEELRLRVDQQVKSVSFVLAREIRDELQLVDQSLRIIQEDWKQNNEKVDLAAWRNQALALTEVAKDIFIANEQGVIVQGTLPQSIGQGFGSAYVTYPNGSLETFDPDGVTHTEDTRSTSLADKIQARQFLTYILRPLEKPKGWWVGASYRSEGITKLFAGAKLGHDGMVGLVAIRRGGLQAIVGNSAQFANLDISESELIEQIRKNDDGVWTGESPTDRTTRIIGYQHIPGRDMGVVVGMSMDTALQPLFGLAWMARSLAAIGTLIVVTVASILIWSIATTRAAQQRQRLHERTELTLTNVRQELAMARARTALTEAELATLLSSPLDGVARLDAESRLRVWNPRFAELAYVPLTADSIGMTAEELFREQARSGAFGEGDGQQEIALRLTILHDSGQSVVPPSQLGPDGERITVYVRGVVGGGNAMILACQDAARPGEVSAAQAGEAEAEIAGETMEL